MATYLLDTPNLNMILVTGGTGYIGSHTVVELLSAGHEVVILDNLSNSRREVLGCIEKITGKYPAFVEGDMRDAALLDDLFTRHHFSAVIHFAGLKAVGESVSKPLEYYENNVYGSMVLFRAMAKHGVKHLVFSSSATVYGDPASLPVKEDALLQAINPYGRTKLMIEEMLADIVLANPDWHIATLRYFNPIGAHKSGLIGEAPNGIPNNLLPYVAQVATGTLEYLSVFGSDYSTPDCTGVRDFIHVVDLARGHLKALDFLKSHSGLHVYNLGTGQGYSVLEIVRAFEKASGKAVPYNFVERRPGDIASCYANADKAFTELRWKAELGLDEMCTDAWRWQCNYSGLDC
ncbi:MAG TPA: UDP-glucose 4-epimerase GalE [Methylophilaceae bacterium]|jgi:UDP-glucose 4-epimerase|nr:UDP-glucose 4-epimerase GalE [Methylophilaceae bacterium]